ncbi:MAG: hypothetical protein ACI9TI_001564 [Natronomonas sp.]|jgi:hypothetical protein
MVQKWNCDRCGFSAWSDSYERLKRKAGTHLFRHTSGNVSKSDFRFEWRCPYCDEAGKTHERDTARTNFKQHLNGHAATDIEQNKHISEEIGRSGNILINTPIESTAADNARVHFVSGSNLAIIITKNPADRLRLFDRQLGEWPDRTVVVTTKRRPLDELPEIDLSETPVELVELDRGLGPQELGETISRIIDVHYTPGQRLSVELDILYDIVKSFELRTSYEFIDMLSTRLREANAVTHIYVAARPQLSSVLNILDGKIDLKLNYDSRIFTSSPQGRT